MVSNSPWSISSLTIGHLDDRHSVLLEQRGDARDESVGVRHVRQHIVGVDDVRPAPLGGKLHREVAAEERVQRVDAALARRRHRTGRRIDAQHRNAPLAVVLQQVAVVARELDHERAAIEASLGDARRDVGGRMHEQRVDERREVRVVVPEQPLRRHRLQDLSQRTVRAERDVQRIARLLAPQVCGRQQPVGQRHVAERQEHAEVRAPAAAAADLAGRGGHAAELCGATAARAAARQRSMSSRAPALCSSRMRFSLMNCELKNSSALVP